MSDVLRPCGRSTPPGHPDPRRRQDSRRQHEGYDAVANRAAAAVWPHGPAAGDGLHLGARQRRGLRPPARRQRGHDLRRTREPVLRRLCEAPHDDGLDCRVDGRCPRAEGGSGIARDGDHGGDGRRPREGPRASEHLVEHQAEREHVGAHVERLARGLLGRHVLGRSQHPAQLGRHEVVGGVARWQEVARPRELARRLGQPEVQQLHVARRRDHDVLGLEVAMNDPLRVRGREPAGDLLAHRERGGRVERPALQALTQVLAFDQLHGDVDAPVVLVDLMNHGDVRVRDCRRRPRLAEEALALLLAARGVDQHLERHCAAELLVLGSVDDAHATFAQATHDVVVIQRRPDEIVADRRGSRFYLGVQRLRERRHRLVVVGGQRRSPFGTIAWWVPVPCAAKVDAAGPPAQAPRFSPSWRASPLAFRRSSRSRPSSGTAHTGSSRSWSPR